MLDGKLKKFPLEFTVISKRRRGHQHARTVDDPKRMLLAEILEQFYTPKTIGNDHRAIAFAGFRQKKQSLKIGVWGVSPHEHFPFYSPCGGKLSKCNCPGNDYHPKPPLRICDKLFSWCLIPGALSNFRAHNSLSARREYGQRPRYLSCRDRRSPS
jgi:hypothetical protein